MEGRKTFGDCYTITDEMGTGGSISARISDLEDNLVTRMGFDHDETTRQVTEDLLTKMRRREDHSGEDAFRLVKR